MTPLTVNVLGIIGRENMRDSAFFQEVLAEGEGLGALKERRALILEVLQDRFGKLESEQFAATLAKIESLEVLRSLSRTARRCASLDDFQAALAST